MKTSSNGHPPHTNGLAAAMQVCRDVTRDRARNFWFGLRLTPEPRRSALYAVYAWSRLGDDIADGEDPPRAGDLAWFRGRTEAALAGRSPAPAGAWHDAVWPALAHVVPAHPIDPGWLRSMMDGLEQDAAHTPFRTAAELDGYCYRVAGTVGLLCVAIWGLREGVRAGEAHAAAARLGRAFQVTNILRDVAEDAEDGRVYLPAALLTAHGLTIDDLLAWARPRACAAAVRTLAASAERDYDAGVALERMVAPDCRAVLVAMREIYAGLLAEIRREPRLVVAPGGARLSGARKGAIALRAVAAGWLGGGR